jgi:hypothetical protein
MKRLIFLSIAILSLSSCVKQTDLKSTNAANTMPVHFRFDGFYCEQWKAVFQGEQHKANVYTITSDSTLQMKSNDTYTVTFSVVTPRCSSGALILSDQSGQGLNIWLGGDNAAIRSQSGVSLDSTFYITTLGE